MNGAYLHLIVNHLAVLGGVFGLLALGHGLAARQQATLRFGLIVLALTGLATGATYLSGEPAEDVVEQLPDVTKSLIETHEDAAVVSLVGGVGLGLVSLGLLLGYRRREIPRSTAIFMFTIALSVSALMGYTAYQGGKINHPEIRSAQVGGGGHEGEEEEGREDR